MIDRPFPEKDAGSRRHAPATARNREPILEVLGRCLPASGLVLEIASGTGEHAVFLAPRLPHLLWQPTDVDEENCRSIAAWEVALPSENLLPPLCLDACAEEWPVREAAVVVNINMIHIAPWSACIGLMRGASRVLPLGGLLYLYGPFMQGGRHTAPSNESFSTRLQAENPAWGVRDLDEVVRLGREYGLRLKEVVPMPVNNLSVIFHR
jgi:hypothetical protein